MQAEWPGCNEAGGQRPEDSGPPKAAQSRPLALALLPTASLVMFRIYYLLPLLIPLALLKRDFSGGMFHRVERWAARLAAKPARAVAFVGVVSFLLGMGLSLCTRIPVPQAQR